MGLTAGTRFGTYEILEPIGKGGMGEVYRAHDSRLGRDVAVKVLPESHRLDPEALQRFDREARLLASLNHPNVATLHGLESAGELQALVMELVEGEALDQRLARAPRGLPVGEAIDIAGQIAAALDAAHERGVVHRDLKPANIKIRPDGTVKVLDFGIAKALAGDRGPGNVGTVTQMPGAIAGTPSYMSPEQASGGTVDRRTDIWALGCVLYEMLTGQRAFEGDSDSRIIARVIERDPDWSLIPRDVPLRIRTLLWQCLEKDQRRRRRDAGDLRLELEAIGTEPPAQAVEQRGSRAGVVWITGAAALAAISAAAAILLHLADEPAQAFSAEITTPASRAPHQFAVSPDGRYIVYVASESTDSIVQILYLRDLETGNVRPMRNTEGAKYPCWSPDSRSIAYFDLEDLYRIDIDGGSPVPLAPSQNGLGCSWGGDTILFAASTVVPLFRVPAGGGEYSVVTELNLGSGERDRTAETNHRFPSFLPDGNRFLFYVAGGTDVAGIHLGSLDSGLTRRLTAADSAGVFVAPDWVAFVQGGMLVARHLDLDRGELTGEPRTLARARHTLSAAFNQPALSASTTGVLALRDAPEPSAVMNIYDDQGTMLDAAAYSNGPEISPNQRYLGYDGFDGSNRDVYVRDLQRGGSSRVTADSTVEGYPVFSPDSESMIYEKQRETDELFELWRADLNRPGSEERLYGEASNNLIPLDWSTNEYLLFRRSDLDFLSSDLLALPLSDDDSAPVAVAVSRNEERMGEISPDGDWVVYDHLVRRGRWEVLVQAFPAGRDVHAVSTEAGGFAPRWSGDGTKIHFISMDGAMMEAAFSAVGPEIEVGAPTERFRTQIAGQAYNHQYAVANDGRFLVNELIVDPLSPPITVISNWKP